MKAPRWILPFAAALSFCSALGLISLALEWREPVFGARFMAVTSWR